ncbi:MAG: arsenate reductase ArsC [Chloroflexi bacterium]|nr:arsenate reductase ArsC [Chloroflexota bacterium]MBM3154717.1 arsenate reductase ArsC [Chloroflexota bacterium]MBM3173531.1 arsenate reductase ArsC [Chloroflexota bacterium]MBM3174560.1 arsenate reductase ArsC [Chloroflexota bacterium]MBM4450293.1 arsenate reductase ArsC [Chloroflexota bacterium]
MKKVLFVCVGNSGRSQMAEAFFNNLAKGKAQAISAGTNPASRVDPTVIELMKELGIELTSHYPKKLTVEMLDTADKIITMGCGVEQACPATLTETEDWGLEDPKGQPKEKIRDIRDKIRDRVAKLLQGMGI